MNKPPKPKKPYIRPELRRCERIKQVTGIAPVVTG